MMPFDYDDYGGGRFVGGTPIDPSIWPWQVSIMHRPTAADPFHHHCGGAIISQDWILTAAVCVHAPQHRYIPQHILSLPFSYFSSCLFPKNFFALFVAAFQATL
jgi:secreted trypsin-like serine protease